MHPFGDHNVRADDDNRTAAEVSHIREKEKKGKERTRYLERKNLETFGGLE
jgi:hypothetical protein